MVTKEEDKERKIRHDKSCNVVAIAIYHILISYPFP